MVLDTPVEPSLSITDPVPVEAGVTRNPSSQSPTAPLEVAVRATAEVLEETSWLICDAMTTGAELPGVALPLVLNTTADPAVE